MVDLRSHCSSTSRRFRFYVPIIDNGRSPTALVGSVNNPNFIGVTFSNLSAVATYPGTNISVGGGFMTNVKFPSDTTVYLPFPFNVTYVLSNDPSLVVLKDLATKCGVSGGATSDITVDYELTVSRLPSTIVRRLP